MAGKRWYEDGCAFAQALDLVGERWALLVVRELMFGAKRFTELKHDLPGIATNILTQRLVDLEASGVLVRREVSEPAKGHVYELTDWGRDLGPVFRVLGRWGAKSPHLVKDRPLSVNGAMVGLNSMFRPQRSRGMHLAIELRLDGEVFAVDVIDRRLNIEPGEHPAPDAVVIGNPQALNAVLYHGMTLEEAAQDGMIVTGDAQKVIDLAAVLMNPNPVEQESSDRVA